ncbi:MAG: sigma-70 family RNA polymerase sigma factor [Deltaproteobacteria bacterium]|nr:sigma-70 family RNA polymerase sigma factor [Deltaproteobacteria bacterium]
MDPQFPPFESLSDEQIVDIARAGQLGAFDALVRRHTPRIYNLAMSMMRNEADARDAMQDAFLNAYRRLDAFRGDAAFGSWLYRIATNACLMRMRQRRRRPEVPLQLEPPGFGEDGMWERPVEDLAPRVDELFEQKELGRVIQAGMDNLPESYQAVFVLADIEFRSMKEIAEILDLTIPNVKTRLHRARLKLREYLADYLEAHPKALVS